MCLRRIQCLVAVAAGFAAMSSLAAIHYVDASGTNPVSPYANWVTAATNIQDAVDAASPGEQIMVTNGVYAAGGRNWYGSGTNRVTLTNSVTLQSVNGPAVTMIVGGMAAGQNLTTATRCVYMDSHSVLSGFTLTNGEAGGGNYPGGGGVSGGTATNCVLINNLATNNLGGGAYRSTLINCKLIGNSAGKGGGASSCTLINCLVVSNTASGSGGLSATFKGGGVYGDSTVGASSLTNCTLVGNAAAGTGGGVDNEGNGAMQNCLVYYNTAPTGSNYANIKLNFCCTVPTLSGDLGSFTNAPMFLNLAGEDFHLQTNSPCINAGNNGYAANATDLDGHPRIAGGTADIGAYEFQSPASVLSYAWAQQYGLPTDGSADYLDSDGDGMNNWQEWIAGTNPTNATSVLKVLAPPATNNASGIKITWQSVLGKYYSVQRATNLGVPSPFTTIVSGIFGQNGTTSYTDTTATNPVPYFFRIGVP